MSVLMGFSGFLRVVVFVFCIVAHGQQALAQEEEIKTKTVGKKSDYTATGIQEPETGSVPSEASGDVKEEEVAIVPHTECTPEDRRLLEEHNKLLIAYYEDFKAVRDGGGEFESVKELEEIQKNSDVYMNFLGSDEYKNSSILRELCNMPAPPVGLEWPEWMPVADPFKPARTEETVE